MKSVLTIRLCLLTATLVLVWTVCALALPPAPAEGVTISQYKAWQRVNPQPLLLPTPLDGLCAMATGRSLIQTSANPHRRKYFTVYVNAVGRSAMMQQKRPEFPVGSVIVKEKSLTKNSAAPELLTVMVKREKGYSPDGGDWEYRVYDGEGTKTQGAGELENCRSCHALNKQTDYVFLDYLSQAVQKRLK